MARAIGRTLGGMGGVSRIAGVIAAVLLVAGCGTVDAAPTTAPTAPATADPTVVPTVTPAPIDIPQLKADAITMTYPKLSKDPDALAATDITGQAQVFQYDSVTTTSHFLGDVTSQGYGYWSDHVWFDVDDPTLTAHVCKDTVIKYWGQVVGPYSYTNVQGGQSTVPEVLVEALNVVSGGC